MLVPIVIHRAEHGGYLRQALVVFIVAELFEFRVGVEDALVHCQRHHRTEHFHQLRIVGQTLFPQPCAQIDAAAEAFAPARRREHRAGFRIHFTEDRLIGFDLELGGDRVIEFGQQRQHAVAFVLVGEGFVQYFRQPFFGQYLRRAHRQRGEQAVHAVEQQVVLADMAAQVLVQLVEFVVA